ncbi:MAG: carbohydrate binding domain-containing protein [Candidatus Cohnella colombiensis]|uniref:Carbohydrate binding domain-containing protein n=1 Tax=Candidatus Cohnella colombiensis TaxID=3121368 RepID=A0AA95JFF2_9BACL|nr:MAG: carbohydrate binding domain-containing protein [Cohnella sp.]
MVKKQLSSSKKLLYIMMCVILVFGLVEDTSRFGRASAASATGSFGDTGGHWSDQTLGKWKDQQLLKGYSDGTFRPNESLSRAEFVKLVNQVFGFTASSKSTFSDVNDHAWYVKDVSYAVEAGYITGYPGGIFKPNSSVKRQEAAKIVASLFNLSEANVAQLDGYSDSNQIAEYARKPFEQLIAGGYMKGYKDGTLRPLASLTRAEAIVMLDRLAPNVINKPGAVSKLNGEGNVLISSSGVTLQEVKVQGDLFITAGVGEGEVVLSNVTVQGTLYVNGGGVNSIYVRNSTINHMNVNKRSSPVRVVFEGTTGINDVSIDSDAIIETGSGVNIESFTVGQSGSGTTLNGDRVNTVVPHKIRNGRVEGSAPTSSGIIGGGDNGNSNDWKLVWSDEFNGDGDHADANGLDLSKWDYQLGTGAEYGLDGWGNSEQQFYSKDNVEVKGGKLVITARNDGQGSKPYTSGRLWTNTTYSKAYGKFEAKIKMPLGKGIWPAFWLMPADDEYGGWASSGEIDIMEARGRVPDKVGGTIHYGRGWPNNKYMSKDYEFPDGQDISGEHVYGLEWEPGEIRWYVDGNLYQTINNWDSTGADQAAKYAFPAPFDKPFYLILNLAVGGTFDGGLVPDANMLPAEMVVDYVRVYELAGRPYKTPVEPSVAQEPLPNVYKYPINGNYVHDVAFEQGFTEIATPDQILDTAYWNFAHISTFNGNGTVSKDVIGGSSYAKVDISAGGNAAHSIQLIQNVTLGKGRWYKLTFDAKASASRDISVKVGGGESRGWSSYSDSLTASLSTEMKGYSMVFQMAADTDVLARLEYNLGLNTNSVWIGNVKLEETTAPDPYSEDAAKEPIAGNHIYNGTFDLGRIDRMTFWKFNTSGGASATASVDATERKLKVNIQSGGSTADAITLRQSGIQLLEPNDYRLTFSAKSDQARSIAVALRKLDGTEYSGIQTIHLTPSMAEYTIEFTMEEDSDPLSQLVFMLGGSNIGIMLDDVKLIRLTDIGVGMLPIAEQFPLVNGDFSNGKESWSEHVQGRYDGWGSSATFEVDQEQMGIDIANIGVNPWDVMLMQNDFPLRKGHTYIVKVDVKSTVPRDMEVVVDGGGTRYLSDKVSLTTTWQTFSYELEPTADWTASFKLLLGKITGMTDPGAHVVTVDNVRVEEKGARERAFPLKNGSFDNGMTDWNEHVQGRYDGWDSVTAIKVVGGVAIATISNVGNNPWDVMLFQGNMPVIKGQTYVVTFEASSSVARNIEAVVENSSYYRYLNQSVSLDVATNTYRFEFTPTQDDTVGLKFLLGKPEVGIVPSSAHQIEFDNITFQIKGV